MFYTYNTPAVTHQISIFKNTIMIFQSLNISLLDTSPISPVQLSGLSSMLMLGYIFINDKVQTLGASAVAGALAVLASFPGRFEGEGKTAWSTLLTHARCMFAYHPFPSRGTLPYSRLLYYRLVLHCTVLYDFNGVERRVFVTGFEMSSKGELLTL